MKKQIIGIGLILLISFTFLSKNVCSDNFKKIQELVWRPAELLEEKKIEHQISGNPLVVNTKYGNAVQFNGLNDGVFLDQMPLVDLNQFTIEVIFFPESGGNFEQRLFHCGEVYGSRILLETRSTASGWYFDAYVKSGKQQKALIEPKLLHPHNRWYHIAYVVDNGKLSTYVNGEKELESHIKFKPIQKGKTSIGVRQNKKSWFKGKIYKIRTSKSALNPIDFLMY